jgi:hypothetical protein
MGWSRWNILLIFGAIVDPLPGTSSLGYEPGWLENSLRRRFDIRREK